MVKGPFNYLRLEHYTACDVADAILAIKESSVKKPNYAGFLCDIVPRREPSDCCQTYVGPAFTVQFQPKDDADSASACQPKIASSNIPPGQVWSDMAVPDSMVVIQAPEGQRNAVVGGIHMRRLERLQVNSLVVDGRIRDQRELEKLDLPVFSKGTSIIGQGFASKPYAVQVPITVAGVHVEPGDIIVADTGEGVVSIPKSMVQVVLEYLESRGDGEDKIMDAVKSGMSVQEAFKRHR